MTLCWIPVVQCPSKRPVQAGTVWVFARWIVPCGFGQGRNTIVTTQLILLTNTHDNGCCLSCTLRHWLSMRHTHDYCIILYRQSQTAQTLVLKCYFCSANNYVNYGIWDSCTWQQWEYNTAHAEIAQWGSTLGRSNHPIPSNWVLRTVWRAWKGLHASLQGGYSEQSFSC